MKTSYQVSGSNSKAPFTLKVHRGDGMADAWESAHGRNPSVDDSATVMPSGYTLSAWTSASGSRPAVTVIVGVVPVTS